eukprot:1180198-Rhodomonas_salina.1
MWGGSDPPSLAARALCGRLSRRIVWTHDGDGGDGDVMPMMGLDIEVGGGARGVLGGGNCGHGCGCDDGVGGGLGHLPSHTPR